MYLGKVVICLNWYLIIVILKDYKIRDHRIAESGWEVRRYCEHENWNFKVDLKAKFSQISIEHEKIENAVINERIDQVRCHVKLFSL